MEIPFRSETGLPEAPLELPGDEVHLWCAPTDTPLSAELQGQHLALLSEEERDRHRRFRSAGHRQEFLVSHALVRVVLSSYTNVPPGRWRFRPNAYGKPEQDPSGTWEARPPADDPGRDGGHAGKRLRFNLAHTEGLAVVALALDHDLGVDVEPLGRDVDPALAANLFSAAEVARLRDLPADLRRQHFLELWTLKEAYIKARGLGLSLPLDAFSFHWDRAGCPRIRFGPGRDDEAARWQFGQEVLHARFLVGLAVRRPESSPSTLVAHEVVPLAGGARVLWKRQLPAPAVRE